jgi:glycosyltransferase involved in cell wall biosynthesis
MQISFLIRTLNEENDLQHTLNLIKQQKGNHEIEIVIVDSGSTDNTIQIAKNNNCKIFTLTQKEWSWGKSLNYGFENTTNDYVVIISAHCFLSSDNFINELEKLISCNNNVAAFYGQQLPLNNYDPFEEYELQEWYPNTEVIMKEHDILIGISNACSIVKKDIWVKYHYDETVDSLEDAIWAHNVLKNGYRLIYTNKISVFHSHPFNPNYIYRKWFWRIYESEKLINEISKKKSIKKYFKVILFVPYKILHSLNEIFKIYSFIIKRYEFVTFSNVIEFVYLKKKAIIKAYYKSFLKIKSEDNYWQLKIPKYSIKLYELKKLLDKKRQF